LGLLFSGFATKLDPVTEDLDLLSSSIFLFTLEIKSSGYFAESLATLFPCFFALGFASSLVSA
jgi:hypothetical protein